MYNFDYHRPSQLTTAGKLLERPDHKLIAGGMSLLPILKLRMNRYAGLIDLGALSETQGIRCEGDALVIGATTTHAVVAASTEVRQAIPALTLLAEGIGDPLVRNRGTLGGSIAHADPGADYPSAVLGLGATVATTQRHIAGDAFFTGLFETALKPDEIITAVHFPIPRKAGYVKYRHPASRLALVGVFVAQTADGVRVAVTGAAPHVFRFGAAEAALTRHFDPRALDGLTLNADGLNSDIHGSAEYRAHCVVELARRAVIAAR